MAVFDGVSYSLSPSLSPTRKGELAAVLDLNGASPHPPYTHLVAPVASHAHNNIINDPAVKLVTDRWVDRSVVMGKRQPEQYYSPDPAMIFSGVVACATDLSAADLEVLSAGITALGGQWRVGLTRDVTHLFALRTGTDKYNTALHFAPQTHMCIVTPHWFDDAVRLGRRIPETPYAWPDPPVLRPGMTLNLEDGPLGTDGRRKRKPADTDIETKDGTDVGTPVRVWDGRRILLSTSLELTDGSRCAIEARTQRAGGIIVPISEDADEDTEEKAVDEADVLVTRWRSGKSYFKAAHSSLLVGTLSWLFSVESSGTLHSPFDSLLWYPTPRGGIPDLIDCEISITNYTGAARDYLKRLITLVGAKFTPSMSQSNKVLVAGFQPSPKTTRALSWSIPVVNHTWLEDCFVEWRMLTVGLERYIVYPPGVDFGKILMTNQDGSPASQPLAPQRLSGGAVPGGRGIGIINVEQEEMRDADYCARVRKSDGILGLLASREALEKATTTDGMSVLEDALTESRPRPRSRAGSVKKTPSSAVRAKLGATSTPLTASATGAFVDHVIELPADDNESDVVGEQRTPVNDKQRARTRPSSVSLSSAARETEAVVRNSGGKSRGENEKVDSKGKGKSDIGKQRTWQTKETERNDLQPRSDASEGPEVPLPPRRHADTGSATPVRSGMKPRPRSRSQSRNRSVLGAESEEEGRAVALESDTEARTGRRGEMSKPARKSGVATNEKEQEKTRKGQETGRVTSRPRPLSRSRSPISVDLKNLRTAKRRLSVVVPSVPKEYLSSQDVRGVEGEAGDGRESGKKGVDADASSGATRKQLMSAASMHAGAAEASTSANKRGRPSHARPSGPVTVSGKSKVQPRVRGEFKLGVSRADDDEDACEEEEANNSSMIVDVPVASTSRGRPRRSAASKATTRLTKIMPDVVNFEKEQKQAKRRWSVGGESIAHMREGKEKGRKRRKVAVEGEEGEEAEVEDVVSTHSTRAKPKPISGERKAKETVVDSNEDVDILRVRNDSNGSRENKGARSRGKELAAIRLMTTGVVLLDDVIKRLTKLGVQMTTKPMDCTHLIAKGIVRTEKFLCAMSVSPYIVTEEWANASAKSGKLLPEKDYLLSDPAAEKKWAFKFADATARAKGPEGGPNLFKQMTFYLTPKLSVDVKLLKNVISAGGGQAQTSTTPTVRILTGKENRYVVSCQEDKGIWRPLVQEGFKVYSPELVLRGALRQEIEWEKEECLVAG